MAMRVDARWRIALLASIDFLSDCDLDDYRKRSIVERWRDSFQSEFKIEATGKKQLSDNFDGNELSCICCSRSHTTKARN